jgi:hypothetical protein
MKWKEFIEKAKKAGVKDDDEIWYMDFSFNEYGDIDFYKDEQLGWSVH